METFKQAAIDYLDAAAFVVANAEQLKIDPRYIIAGGSSAGAEGTLNAVFMREYLLTIWKNIKMYNLLEFFHVQVLW